MVVYTLEQRGEILQYYFENHGNVAKCVRKLRTPENIAATTSIHRRSQRWTISETSLR